jgi:carotene biosynthesis associated membrane protein
MIEATAPVTRYRSERLFIWALILFAGSIAFSILGTLSLQIGPVAAFFAPHIATLIKIPTWVYMALLPVLSLLLYWNSIGWKRSLGFLAWGSVIGAAAELLGTQTGFPFGPYEYGPWLGPKIAGHVPWFIPPSWYALSIISLDLARRMGFGRVGRILGCGVFMVLWDVSLDPAMSRAFPFWTYGVEGFYFGMPLMNWVGWFLTSVVIAVGYETFLGGLPARSRPLPARWAHWLYALNLLFPALICLTYGLEEAAIAGLLAMVIPLAILYRPPIVGGRTSPATNEGSSISQI